MSTADDWLTTFHRRSEPRCRIVCFPHAGGSAGAFRALSAAAPETVAVAAVQYPGRQWRQAEPSLTSIAHLAAGAAEGVRAAGDIPVLLYGHSMGALVAFEVARSLAGSGVPVLRLVASGSNAPTRPRWRHAPGVWDDAAILTELRGLGGTAQQVLDDEEMLRLAMPALRADYRALREYTCAEDARIEAPITVVLGRDDPTTTAQDAEPWRRHTLAACDTEIVEGDHFFPLTRPATVMEIIMSRVPGVPFLRIT
ncbi:alpha/beta fold hydrolase [Actinoplanes missouriensis]|uniref:thioesterase II family protein n=1 Tax=Actinoplanes missouriensis TaxID=1866 RepID=UPI0033CCD6F8